VAETGEPAIAVRTLGDWLGSRRHSPDLRYPGVCVPVWADDRRLGALGIVRDSTPFFHSQELELALAAGRHLALCLRGVQLYHQARDAANTDELTGLYNYRYLDQRLEEEVERAGRYGRDLSLLMLDVDNLKRYNDLFGHPQGNVALRQLAGTVLGAVRRVDVVARYGGDELAVILPETDMPQAMRVAERIADAVRNQPALASPSGIMTEPLSVSIGVSSFPALARDSGALIRLADEALYRAKGEGACSVHAWEIGEAGSLRLPAS
jgi:diguanylate cyclase (GGDEF)-like protein